MANLTEYTSPSSSKARPVLEPNRTGNKHTGWVWLFGIVIILGAIFLYTHGGGSDTATTAKGGRAAGGPVPVVAGTAMEKDVPIYLDGLGTVVALNTVTVRARVDGQLEKVAFEEGQDVHAGDLLAIIDPAPYRAALAQAQARQNQDQAQLANAKLDLSRYTELVAKKVISSQQFDTQKALVDQLDATVRNDAAAIESAKVNLNYTTIVSPLDGRVGIRIVDQGNIVHASDQNGLLVITQLHPISLIFTLPEQTLSQIHQHTMKGEELEVLAVDRDNKTTLDTGKLSVIDNQIDTTTGTIKLKATFPNPNLQLWPGQFVNARLHLLTRPHSVVVPAAVVQRGPNGPYVFVIQADQTVQLRPVKVGQIEGGEALIEEGLAAGENVVVDGQYKLQPGSKVVVGPAAGAGPKSGAAKDGGQQPGHELK